MSIYFLLELGDGKIPCCTSSSRAFLVESFLSRAKMKTIELVNENWKVCIVRGPVVQYEACIDYLAVSPRLAKTGFGRSRRERVNTVLDISQIILVLMTTK